MNNILLHFTILMPAGISLLMLITYLTRMKKNGVQKLFTASAALSTIYFFADACYVVDYADTVTFILADTLAHFAAPALIVTAALILYEMHIPERHAVHIKAMYAFALGVGLMCLIPYEMMSWDECQRYLQVINQSGKYPLHAIAAVFGINSIEYFHYIVSVPIYYIICGGGILAIAIYIIHCMRKDHYQIGEMVRFVFKGDEFTPFKSECWLISMMMMLISVRMLMGRGLCIAYPGITMCISLGMTLQVYLILYNGLVTHLSQYTLSELFHPLLFMPTLTTDNNKAGTLQAFSTDEKHLLEELQTVMHQEHMYTNPNLTIEDVANRMGTNRVYVAQIVNQHYNITFREYINFLRLKAGKEYMLAHPDAKQEEVAKICGYSDAASFNKRFRQQEGCTPREWIQIQPRQNN